MSPIQVAVITVAQAFDLSRPHESAAQYHTIRVEPGEYPVEVRTSKNGIRYVAALFTGVCVHSGYGSKRYHHEEGQPSSVTLQPYKYELRSGKACRGTVRITNDAAIDLASGV